LYSFWIFPTRGHSYFLLSTPPNENGNNLLRTIKRPGVVISGGKLHWIFFWSAFLNRWILHINYDTWVINILRKAQC
jgi:hypothetical protein